MVRLSVILPVYNCERYVGEAIRSILDQTYTDFELLIADDGSTDSSRKVIDGYSGDTRVRIYHNSRNEGKVATSNRLLGLCRGRYVTVHDADDISEHTRFEKQVALLEGNDSIIMCGTSFQMLSAGDKLFKEVIMPVDFDNIVKDIAHASQFHGPTMVMRRESLNNCLYRSFFNDYNEDCDLALRLIQKGCCTNLADILYRYRILPDSLSKAVTARKKNLYQMAVAFHKQREITGTDDLMEGNYDRANQTLHDLMRPYLEDISLIYRENAAFLMYYQLKTSAIRNAWWACYTRPFHFHNWRTLQYCVRKTLLGI